MELLSLRTCAILFDDNSAFQLLRPPMTTLYKNIYMSTCELGFLICLFFFPYRNYHLLTYYILIYYVCGLFLAPLG